MVAEITRGYERGRLPFLDRSADGARAGDRGYERGRPPILDRSVHGVPSQPVWVPPTQSLLAVVRRLLVCLGSDPPRFY